MKNNRAMLKEFSAISVLIISWLNYRLRSNVGKKEEIISPPRCNNDLYLISKNVMFFIIKYCFSSLIKQSTIFEIKKSFEITVRKYSRMTINYYRYFVHNLCRRLIKNVFKEYFDRSELCISFMSLDFELN